MDPNLHWVATWRENVAFDQKLPILGIVTVADIDQTQVEMDESHQEKTPHALPRTRGPAKWRVPSACP